MNKEQAIKICRNFSINVYNYHPEFVGNKWRVEEDIRSITAVKELMKEYDKLNQALLDIKEYMVTLKDEYADDDYDIKDEVFQKIYYGIIEKAIESDSNV